MMECMPQWERLTADQLASISRNRRKTMPCQRPGCHKVCAYRDTGSGRQKLFCSDSCRVTYTRARRRLIELWLTLEWNSGYLDPAIPTDDIASLQAHVAWELDRYGGLDDTVYLALPEPPTRGNLTEAQHRQQLRKFHSDRRSSVRAEVADARTRRGLADGP